jgi:hypothetical protein
LNPGRRSANDVSDRLPPVRIPPLACSARAIASASRFGGIRALGDDRSESPSGSNPLPGSSVRAARPTGAPPDERTGSEATREHGSASGWVSGGTASQRERRASWGFEPSESGHRIRVFSIEHNVVFAPSIQDYVQQRGPITPVKNRHRPIDTLIIRERRHEVHRGMSFLRHPQFPSLRSIELSTSPIACSASLSLTRTAT